MLVINPIGGLANRMRAIVAGLEFAGTIGIEAKVVWGVNRELNARADELFDICSFGVDTIHIPAWKQKFCYDLPRKSNLYLSPVFKGNRYVMQLSDMNGTLSEENLAYLPNVASSGKDILIQSGLEFHPFDDETYRNMIRPISVFYESASSIISTHSNPVGFHIRRTDNRMSILNSPLYMFYEAAEKEIATSPDVTFYVATDDESVKQGFVSRFGQERVLYCERSADRTTKSGIKDALTEMMVLSKCRKIYGSYWSSFSEAAARLGNKPLIIVKKQ